MIIFIRHAERGDNEIPQKLSEVSYDPPIIEASSGTIQKTSIQMKELFQKHGIKKFEVICSKFLRCIMTMKGLEYHLKQFGFKSPQQYLLDDRVSEYLREDWFPEYPLPSLIYQSKYLKKYVNDLQYKEEKKLLEFPQNYVHFHNRINQFRKSLRFPKEQTCLIVMTHGFVVRELCWRMNQLPTYQNQIKYCGYAAYSLSNNIQNLLKARL